MYRFQIKAETQPGETIALVGAIPEMGLWDSSRCVQLQTSRNHYPLWWVDLDLSTVEPEGLGNPAKAVTGDRRIEYKYLRLQHNGRVIWETLGANRWVPLEPYPLPSPIIVEDGDFGSIQPHPYGYFAAPLPPAPVPAPTGRKIVVLGSSVALGCSTWLLRGWAWQLGQALQQQYGHQLINVSEIGANVVTTIARFSQVVLPQQPDVVIIALSLGNEGLATSSPSQHRTIQRRFENGLQQLIKMTREAGAMPVLAGVYPNQGYTLEHSKILQDTHRRLLTWGVPVLDWLAALDDGKGRWQAGLSFDPAHPNTAGHARMYAAIDQSLFDRTRSTAIEPCSPGPTGERVVYQDIEGFSMVAGATEPRLQIINTSRYPYTIAPHWQDVQAAIRSASLPAGLYLAEATTAGTVFSLFIEDNGGIETTLTMPPATTLVFYPVLHFFAQNHLQLIFHDGHLGLLKVSDRRLHLINDSDHEYNIHPMWKEVRTALKAMSAGVYEDSMHQDRPFRTMMIGKDGLESRIKIPAKAALTLDYQGSLASISRVAIMPLGDRCAVRMLLYKLEYDGPAFPFDLTRTTSLADVADIIQSDFSDMWNPHFLHYNHDAQRIYHTKWTGLSFAHEVEDTDDPLHDMTPIYERMRTRYTARSQRFWYTLQKCDKVLFMRTGICDRASVMDLIYKLQMRCQGKPFRLLLFSPQPSAEFAQLPNVLHYNLEFNPDRMYEDLGHWEYCTKVMQGVLNSLGISSKNLFWCPPIVPQTRP